MLMGPERRRESARDRTEGTSSWPSPRCSDASVNSSGPTSTRCSTARRTRRRCWTRWSGATRRASARRGEGGEGEVKGGWRAAAGWKRADEMRAAGNAADADRFDSLAKIAIKRQIGFEDQVKTFGPQIEQQTALVSQLKDGLNVMRAKREELVQKKDQLIARAKMAQAQVQVQQSIKSVNIMDPTSEVSRFEEKVRHEEAKARGMAEVASSSLDAQFASLDDSSSHLHFDARLAALKKGG